MKVYKHCDTFVLLIVCAFFVQINAKSDLCGTWDPYKDDLCYQIYDQLSTFDHAKDLCSGISQYDQTSMAIIRSKGEQDFLVNYVFKTKKKVDNFWIGAKYDSDTFHWVDNSTLGYTNWLKDTKHKTDTCAQVQVEEDWIGKWLDVSCTAKSLVVCQKVQWNLPRLQKAYAEAQHRKQISVDESNKGIQVQTKIISEANKTIEEAKKTIEEANQKIAQQEHKIQEANQKLTQQTNAFQQKNEEFEKQENRISESFKALELPLFQGCSWREFVVANFNASCYHVYVQFNKNAYSCNLYREKVYKFEMKFIANQDSQTVHVKRTFQSAELKDNMNDDGCKYVKCPLVKGQEYSFIIDKYHINFENIESVFSGDFYITLTGDNGTLACSYMYYRVYDTTYHTTPEPPTTL